MLTIAIPHCKYTAVNNYISSSTGLKEILAEVFGARPSEVEEMIQRWLEESGIEEREEGRGRRRSAWASRQRCEKSEVLEINRARSSSC